MERYRPGQKPLGYCNRYERPITYYTGRCKGYKPRQVENKRLTEFIGRG